MKMRKDNAKCFWTRSYSLFLTGELVNKMCSTSIVLLTVCHLMKPI